MNRRFGEDRFRRASRDVAPITCRSFSDHNEKETIEALISEIFEDLEGAYADSTLRGYRYAFDRFASWCQQRGQFPLPADPKVIADFIGDQIDNYRPATIRNRVTAIGTLHILADFPDPTRSRHVRLALRRMFRLKGRRQRQALGLTADIRDKLIDATSDDLIGFRDRALVSIAYDTLRRRSELVALRIEDLQPVDEGGGTILVRRSKSDQEGEGKYAYVAPQSLDYCQSWMRRARLKNGYLLRSINRHTHVGKDLYAGSVGRVYKKLARRAGLPDETVRRLSGHSARVGAAQDMAAAGIDLIAIMQAGGWRTPEIVGRYIENLDVMRGGRYRLEQYRREQDARSVF